MYVRRCRDASLIGTSENFCQVVYEIIETGAPALTSMLRILPLISMSTVIGCILLVECCILNNGSSESKGGDSHQKVEGLNSLYS